MGPIEKLIAKLNELTAARRRPAAARCTAGDLVRRKVRAGAVELPILNLAGLWALRALARDEGDDAGNLLRIIWVLENQESDRILDAAANPPTSAELAAVGRRVDLASLGDYVEALETMLAAASKKKARAETRD